VWPLPLELGAPKRTQTTDLERIRALHSTVSETALHNSERSMIRSRSQGKTREMGEVKDTKVMMKCSDDELRED
jgi:hypothetical protein